jgi:hypothetical protein
VFQKRISERFEYNQKKNSIKNQKQRVMQSKLS